MLPVARILKPNGNDGGVLIGLHDIETEDFKTLEPVYIYFDGLPVPFFVFDMTPRGQGRAVVHLSGVDNLEDAEEICGQEVFADVVEEDEAEPDFNGWTIFDRGVEIGRGGQIEPIPGNPCLNITLAGGGSALIPLHEDFIENIDERNKTLSLVLPAGLL